MVNSELGVESSTSKGKLECQASQQVKAEVRFYRGIHAWHHYWRFMCGATSVMRIGYVFRISTLTDYGNPKG